MKKKKTRTKAPAANPGIRRRRPRQASKTQTLRTQAQIAMLKRALLAAEDEGLPHKAICEYLHTLSQMAKLEGSSNPAQPSGRGNHESHSAPAHEAAPRRSKRSLEQLRQAVADIYGIADLPSDDAATPPPSNKPNDESKK